MELNIIHNTDCLQGLKSLPDNSIDCCVTSPPYFGLRDYGVDGQIGLEDTPELFIARLTEVFDEVRRVLKPAGTLWMNLGDSYAGNGGQFGSEKSTLQGRQPGSVEFGKVVRKKKNGIGLKSKDLIGIPWMAAFALRTAGWYLRQDIIWSKPNPMPESVTDRCTKSHEYIFMLSKCSRYYYDAESIRQPAADSSIKRLLQDVENQKGSNRVPGKTNGPMKAVMKTDKQRGHSRRHAGFNDRWDKMSKEEQSAMGANKRSVWQVATKPFPEAHFATFPQDLIVDMIKAGCTENGIVLDPFMGAGTTALVARKLNRNFIGFELNPAYIEIAEKRLSKELGIFK